MSLHSSLAEVGNDLSCEKILQTNTFLSQKIQTVEESVTSALVQRTSLSSSSCRRNAVKISVCAARLPWRSTALKEHSLISMRVTSS